MQSLHKASGFLLTPLELHIPRIWLGCPSRLVMATHSADADRGAPQKSEYADDASKAVRARVSRACTRCRARVSPTYSVEQEAESNDVVSQKDRCDGMQPQCSNCINAGQPCVYVAGNKKRGLPEGYVRGLEKLWAVMGQKIHGLDEAVRRVMTENEEELVRVWNHHKYGDELHTAWKESNVLSELEKLLARLEQQSPSDLKRKREREDDGEGTASLQSTHDDVLELPPLFKVAKLPSPTAERDVDGSEATSLPPGRISSPNPVSIPLPRSIPSLMDHYFKYTHCWFPILDRPYTLRRYYEYSRSSNPLQPQSSDLAYIWAMCAYAKQQASHPEASTTTDIASESPSVAEMRAIARSLIPAESGPFCLGHVQALLLLTLLDLGTNKTSSAWILVGFAVRVLLDLLDTAPDHHARLTAALQGCFILDTLLSMLLRMPPHLKTEHLANAHLVNEDGHEEWEPWGVAIGDPYGTRAPAFVISCFNRLTELCMFANSSLKTELGQSRTGQAWMRECPSPLALQELAVRYPFQAMELEPRPPHQMLLQACHFVMLGIASPLSNTAQEEATTKFFRSLELFDRSWNTPGRSGIPSIMTLLTQLIHRSPGRHVVSDQFNQTISRLAPTWPNFMPAANRSHPKTCSPANTPSQYRATVPCVPRDTLQHTTGCEIPSSGAYSTNYQPSQDGHNGTAENTGQARGIHYTSIPYFAGSAEQPSQMASTSIDYGAMNLDVPQHSVDSVLMSDRGAARRTVTSPSFDGDEIDALFHEMAQLDTTQWALDRTQDLKDFGFADDSTFEAFCNDPGRLTLPEGYMDHSFNGNNSSNNDTSRNGGGSSTQRTYPGSNGDGSQGSARDPQGRTFDVFDMTW